MKNKQVKRMMCDVVKIKVGGNNVVLPHKGNKSAIIVEVIAVNLRHIINGTVSIKGDWAE